MATGRARTTAERVWPLIVLALAMLVLGAAAASGHLFPVATPSDGTPQVLPSTSHPVPTLTLSPVVVAPGTTGAPVRWLLPVAYAVLALLVVLAARALIAHVLARRRPATALPAVADADTLPGVDLRHELLGEARRAQVDVAAAADVRDAVIAAYQAFEQVVARGGVARLSYETPGELVARVLRSIDVPDADAARLLALYERVRFGAVASDELMRAEATRCLAAIEQSIGSLS